MQFELDKFVVKQCRHGVMVWPKQDRVIGAALAHYGEFAEGENRIMARYLRAGDVAVARIQRHGKFDFGAFGMKQSASDAETVL